MRACPKPQKHNGQPQFASWPLLFERCAETTSGLAARRRAEPLGIANCSSPDRAKASNDLDALVNCAKQRSAGIVQSFYANPITVFQIRLKVLVTHAFEYLPDPRFSDASAASGFCLVADGACANDRASTQASGAAEVGDDLRKVEHHFGVRAGFSKALAIEVDAYLGVQHAFFPAAAERGWRHCNGGKAGGRFALVKAKSFGQFFGDQAAQGDIV